MKPLLLFTSLLFLTTTAAFAQTGPASELIKAGVNLYDEGKYTEAIDKYKEAYLLDSNSIVLFSEMAMTYLALKDYTNTASVCQRAIQKFEGNKLLKHIYGTYGDCLDESQKPEEALKIYNEGLSKFPDHYLLHFNKGITELGLKRNYEARQSFQNALRLNPRHVSSWYYLGVVEDNFGNRIPAILALSRFLILEPKGTRAKEILPYLTNKVNNMYYQKKTGKAIATLSSAGPRTDTTANSFNKVEESLSMLAVMTTLPGIEKEGQSEVAKFEEKEQTIFELLKACKKNNNGFYWDFVAPYYIAMEEQKYVKAFANYVNYPLTEDQAVKEWVKNNGPAIDQFSNWNKNYQW
jgi:tetratricopeptide (TPR) repeat protein